MGVTGLTTYIYERSDLFFEQFKLKDTRLVIDGNSIASNLYSPQQQYCCFGGDYDIYYENVKQFFMKLKKCKVEAFVIFDGGMEEKKLKTRVKRGEERLIMLKNFQLKKWKNMFFPLFMYEVFKDVLMELEIKFATCWFEADQEIASLACFLDCPVMSCDSDFFIFGCTYIPINKTCHEMLAWDEDSNSFYMQCEIYQSTKLAAQFGGDTHLLPYVAVLLGNDYTDGKVFENFFEHVSIRPSHCGVTFGQAKTKAVISWLKNETLDSVRSSILKHVRKADAEKVVRVMDLVIKGYELKTPTTLEQLELVGRGNNEEDPGFPPGSDLSKVPPKFVERFKRNEVPNFVVDMINLKKYYPILQIEDATKESSHVIAFPILVGIYYVVRHLVGSKMRLRMVFSLRGQLVTIPLQYAVNCFTNYDNYSLMFAPTEVKMNFIYDVLSFDESDIYLVEHFDRQWRIFAMTLVFWMKNAGDELCKYHFHALVLMALANITQDSVGHFDSYSAFMRRKAARLNKLSKTPSVAQDEIFIFPDMLENISEFEHLRFTEKFIKLRGTVKEVTEKGYLMRTIHAFAMFQSSLYHLMKLNELLGFPYPRTQVHKIYSGTLAYNLYYYLSRKERLKYQIRETLETLPNYVSVYDYFVEMFMEYWEGDGKRDHRKPVSKRRRDFCRRKRR